MIRTDNFNHHEEHRHGERRGEGRGYGRGLGGGHRHGEHHDHDHAGRNGGGGFGPDGYCVCIKCGYSEEHRRGIKCTTLKCPECGHVMARKELLEEKRKRK